MLVYQAPFANMKIERRGWPEIPLILWRCGTKHVAMGKKIVQPKLWSTFSRILLQRMKQFGYKFIFDQNLVEYMTSSPG